MHFINHGKMSYYFAEIIVCGINKCKTYVVMLITDGETFAYSGSNCTMLGCRFVNFGGLLLDFSVQKLYLLENVMFFSLWP